MLTSHQICLGIIVVLIHRCTAWPPEYSVDLHTFEEFEINDPISEDQVSDVYQEEELIQSMEEKYKNRTDTEKYFQLHKWADKKQELEKKRNQFNLENPERSTPRRLHESYEDNEDDVAWQAGFVDLKGKYIHRKNEKVYYVNDMAKDLIKRRMEERPPREADADDANDEPADYKSLETEYEAEVQQQRASNETLHLNDTKEEETAKESIDDIIGGKAHLRNCTEEERNGLGIAAVECFWSDLHDKNATKDERPKMFKRVLRVAGIWFGLYLLVAVPCFCQRGWCCCCFRLCFKCCRPDEQIEAAKTYLGRNPLGVRHTKEGKKETFKPTNYERYAQKELMNAVMKL